MSERPSATLDENERRGVCQSLRDLIQHGGNMDHEDRKNLMWKAISLIETPRSETQQLSREMDTQRATYEAIADAVNDVATEAHTAFVKAGLTDLGDWDGDNIVEDVKRGIVDAVERLSARSAIEPSKDALICAALQEWHHGKLHAVQALWAIYAIVWPTQVPDDADLKWAQEIIAKRASEGKA